MFWRAYRGCIDTVAAEYTGKIKREFAQIEREWKAKHNPLPLPLSLPVVRRYDPPDYEGYFEVVAPTRSDFAEYTKSGMTAFARLQQGGERCGATEELSVHGRLNDFQPIPQLSTRLGLERQYAERRLVRT